MQAPATPFRSSLVIYKALRYYERKYAKSIFWNITELDAPFSNNEKFGQKDQENAVQASGVTKRRTDLGKNRRGMWS